MKTLKERIQEGLKINSKSKFGKIYNYQPKTKTELIKLINKLIQERGNNADLNDIDTSQITDMSYLFGSSDFNGDIYYWDVSNVIDMMNMFIYSKFTGDISQWDVSNVENMIDMFYKSKFNGDISNWKVNNKVKMTMMFNGCPLENNPPKWYKK